MGLNVKPREEDLEKRVGMKARDGRVAPRTE